MIFPGKLFIVNSLFNLPCFIKFYTCVDLFSKTIHLIAFLFIFLRNLGLVIVGDVIITQLKMGDFIFALLKLLYLHHLSEELL